MSLPACTKVELWDLTVCIVVNFASCSDLDLCPTMPNIEPVLHIFINYNVFQFYVPSLITF